MVHLRSYIVKDSKFDEFWDELTEQNYFDNWMPNSHPESFYNLFVGEYPWAQSYHDLNNPYHGHDGWSKGNRKRLSRNVLSTTEHITLERGYDCSINGTFQINLPIDELINELGLDWLGKRRLFLS